MFALTKKTDYALIALWYLAHCADRVVSAREISDTFGIPSALLMNILKTLNQHKIVASTRGTKGGYEIARPLAEISVYDVILALEGAPQLVDCAGHEPNYFDPACKVGPACPVHAPLKALHLRLQQCLRDTTLADVILARGVPTLQKSSASTH